MRRRTDVTSEIDAKKCVGTKGVRPFQRRMAAGNAVELSEWVFLLVRTPVKNDAENASTYKTLGQPESHLDFCVAIRGGKSSPFFLVIFF